MCPLEDGRKYHSLQCVDDLCLNCPKVKLEGKFEPQELEKEVEWQKWEKNQETNKMVIVKKN